MTSPPGVIRPILPAASSVNQRLPSGPAAMPTGWLPAVGTVNSVITAGGRDAADLVADDLGEPEVAVRPRRDAVWDAP